MSSFVPDSPTSRLMGLLLRAGCEICGYRGHKPYQRAKYMLNHPAAADPELQLTVYYDGEWVYTERGMIAEIRAFIATEQELTQFFVGTVIGSYLHSYKLKLFYHTLIKI